MNLKVSIITVTRNNKNGLKNAIESVRNQSYKNLEHIIIDGKSDDGTVEMLEDFSDKLNNSNNSEPGYIFRWISEKDNGIYDAINKGIKLAEGDIVGLLHSDDFYYDSNVLEKYVDYFSNNYVDVVYSDLVYIKPGPDKKNDLNNYENGKTNSYKNYKVIRYWKTHKDNHKSCKPLELQHLIFGWMPPHPTLFIRRPLFEKIGLYKCDMKVAADYEFILRLFYVNKVVAGYIPAVTYCMQIGGNSNKSLKNILLKSYEDYLSMKLNGIPMPFITLIFKNIRKINQFIKRQN